MGYLLPATVPGWQVEVYALAISNPYAASRVGWLKSSSHEVRTFRTKAAAERHKRKVEDNAKWSLIPIRWDGRISQVARKPDWLDHLRAFLNMKPLCGSFDLLYQTRPQ